MPPIGRDQQQFLSPQHKVFAPAIVMQSPPLQPHKLHGQMLFPRKIESIVRLLCQTGKDLHGLQSRSQRRTRLLPITRKLLRLPINTAAALQGCKSKSHAASQPYCSIQVKFVQVRSVLNEQDRHAASVAPNSVLIGTIHGHRLKRQALQLLHNHLSTKRRNRAAPAEKRRVGGAADHKIPHFPKR